MSTLLGRCRATRHPTGTRARAKQYPRRATGATTPQQHREPGSANPQLERPGKKGPAGLNDNRAPYPGDKGNGNGKGKGKGSHPGQSQKCKAHNVAYIVSGTLVNQTLVKNADGTYSGTLEVEVTHTNNHAVKGKTSYPVSKVHVTFDNGSVGLRRRHDR